MAHLALHLWAIFVSGLRTVQAACGPLSGQLSWAGFVGCCPRLSWSPWCTNRHPGRPQSDSVRIHGRHASFQPELASRLDSFSTLTCSRVSLFCSQIFPFSAYLDPQLSPWDPDASHTVTLLWSCPKCWSLKRNVHLSCLGLPVTPSEVVLLCQVWLFKQEQEIETRTVSRLGLEDRAMLFWLVSEPRS